MATATKLKCDFCNKATKAPQGKVAHERFCEKNPNRLTRGPARDSGWQGAVEAVRALGGSATPTDVAGHLGKTRGAVTASLISALRRGILIRSGPGTYALTDQEDEPTVIPNRRPSTSPSTAMAAIMRTLRRVGEPMQSKDLIAASGVQKSSGHSAITKAVTLGEVVKVSRGTYDLAKRNGIQDLDFTPVAVRPSVRDLRSKLALNTRVEAGLLALFPSAAVPVTGLLDWIDTTKEFLDGNN